MSDKKPKRACIYAYTAQTCSPEVDKQVLACRAVALANDFAIEKTEIDGGRSGPNMIGRDGLARVLQAAEAGEFDTLIIKSLDRLGRDANVSASILVRLQMYRIQLVTADAGVISLEDAAVRMVEGAGALQRQARQ
ncbi:recombinase family protein [Brevundimonas naejangsanensis]|uniref:recombinase family protein n=1 Tax=Brevundimonas naejangsanensis TaxID=588932 RepID=UPI00106A61BA|nr:recombinase family protein [Brevundimonas naejangsanensis]QBQ49552.1 recombinase family protein [Brevundimonas naejangsanensis]